MYRIDIIIIIINIIMSVTISICVIMIIIKLCDSTVDPEQILVQLTVEN